MEHPIDGEALEDVTFTVTARHKNTGLTGTGTSDDEQEALSRAKDDLLAQLEQVGGC